MPRDHMDDSSSSSDSHFHDDNGGGGRRNRQKISFGSSCGIRSVNEYCDQLSGTTKTSAKAYKERRLGDGEAWAGAEASDHENGQFSSRAGAGVAALKNGCHSAYNAAAKASAEFGAGGAIADANADTRVYNYCNDKVDLDLAKGYVGGGIGAGLGGAKAKAEIGVDVVDMNLKLSERQEMDVNLGLNADTGAEVGVDGVSASVLGLGFSLGRRTGISTPFGGINFKLW